MKSITFICVFMATISLDFSSNHVTKETRHKAPELELTDVNGKTINLTSLKGNIVLIDFWASWCKPCRLENPVLVHAYNKYHNSKFKDAEKFEIFSISLDQDKARWLDAIEKDNLIWEHHGCEFKVWKSEAAKKYNIRAIPQNVLIDADGYIIATNLRGAKLEAELEKLVKQ